MRRRPYIFLGDLLRSIEILRITDPALSQLVLQMLTLQRLEAGPAPTQKGAHDPRRGTVSKTQPPPSVPSVSPPPDTPYHPDRMTIRSPGLRKMPTTVAPTAPPWLPTVTAMPRPPGGTQPARVAPLFPLGQTRGLLTAMLASWDAEGPLHVPHIVEALAQLRALPVLPRENAATMRRGVQFLVDGGLGMSPFRFDVEQLLQAIARLLPPERMRTFHYIGSPLRKCLADGADVLKTWAPPARGTPVMLVSDLGIGGPSLNDDRATVPEWLEFANAVRRAGCPLLALVPYGPDRWPRVLARAVRIIHWDHRTSAAAVRRTVLQVMRGMA
jgi:hypothetical protein